MAFGNGMVQEVAYNNRLQVSQLKLRQGGAEQQRYDYKYGTVDQAGNVNEAQNTGQVGRIEGFIGGTKQWQQRMTYDSVNKRLELELPHI